MHIDRTMGMICDSALLAKAGSVDILPIIFLYFLWQQWIQSPPASLGAVGFRQLLPNLSTSCGGTGCVIYPDPACQPPCQF